MRVALLAAIALLSTSDGSPAAPAAPPGDPATGDPDPGSGELSADGVAALRALLEAGVHPDLLWPDFASLREDARRFYEARGETLAWIRRSGPTAQARALADVLRSSEAMGLDPGDYDGPRWARRLEPGARPPSEAGRVRLDVALTVSVLRYVSDVRLGRVDPGPLRVGLGEAAAVDLAGVAGELAGADDVRLVLERLEPPFAAYRRTLDALRTYLRLAREAPGEPLPVPATPLEPGAFYPAAPRLATVLRRLGDLRDGEGAARDETVYAPALVEAVRRFQARHGLDPDGRLGARTVSALNVPLSRRVMQLALTLERWRSGPRSVAAPLIVVNIPEYRLRALGAEGRPELAMRVVLGAAYRHQTPVFVAGLRTVVFRPYWNVPRGITRNELLPRLAGDPDLLARERYDLVDRRGDVAGVELTPEALRLLRTGELRLRQRPGPANALGLVKFVFPNTHEVYLHGTPSPRLFARSRRDFSHGCIRVEDPLALAEWVLHDDPRWSADAITAAMNGTRTRVVDVGRPIPVLIVYGTAVVSERGEVRFLDDVYGHDAALERALASRRPYPD
ncbi:L,D-transpeptidase family protein [Anaeromyxobacter oryzae]|uniref:L,D-transpeptidase n=1 Tax=Anaeromyxobacter oryzae TaxID=2918170 RepID=A0ABN6MLK0_9BACT|nr:L,D-transpeptidase family protein [Anaeromyxobacter oryzae]BDG01926.1 L,D-transpeptidase [Anaeromyxobacter oryzae]